jgi:DNA replication protein DnaC
MAYNIKMEFREHCDWCNQPDGSCVGHPEFGEPMLDNPLDMEILGYTKGLMDRNLSRSGFPKSEKIRQGFKGWRYDTQEREALFVAAKAFVDDFQPGRRGLWMSGLTGVGKTHLAAAIGVELMRQNHPVRFLFVPQWLSALRNQFGAEHKDRDFSIDPGLLAVENHCVILDDLGSEMTSPWSMEKIMILTTNCLSENTTIILTTNMPSKGLSDAVGGGQHETESQRIVSRIAEHCDTIGEFPREDVRKLRGDEFPF